MVNVYESVDSNKQKSLLIVVLFSVFVFISAYFMAGGLGWYYGYESSGIGLVGLALIVSGVTSFASYYWSDRIILTISGAKPANKREHFNFYTATENLCLAAGLPLPRLYVIEDTALNAFATGRDPKHAVICTTTGLLGTLNRTELEGVIGHELSHIGNYDMLLMSVVTVMVGIITLLGDWLVRASWYGSGRSTRENKNSVGSLLMLLGIVFALLSPIISRLIQLSISRRREYFADAASVKLTRQPGGLISALRKLAADSEPLEAANKATAHLYITNPLKNNHGSVGWFAGLFNTHPPITSRISALEQMV